MVDIKRQLYFKKRPSLWFTRDIYIISCAMLFLSLIKSHY